MENQNLTTKEEAHLLINRFYEVETNGVKMDYDTAVECAKIAVEEIILSGHLHLPEDRLYWKMVRKECDMLHSFVQEESETFKQEKPSTITKTSNLVNPLNNYKTF
jgi:hypothetical protein